MNREDELNAEMIIGDDARQFLESELGRTILGMAEQEKLSAQEELCSVDAEDAKRIRDLQNTVARANSFAGWLIELINRGADAEKILMSEKVEA